MHVSKRDPIQTRILRYTKRPFILSSTLHTTIRLFITVLFLASRNTLCSFTHASIRAFTHFTYSLIHREGKHEWKVGSMRLFPFPCIYISCFFSQTSHSTTVVSIIPCFPLLASFQSPNPLLPCLKIHHPMQIKMANSYFTPIHPIHNVPLTISYLLSPISHLPSPIICHYLFYHLLCRNSLFELSNSRYEASSSVSKIQDLNKSQNG